MYLPEEKNKSKKSVTRRLGKGKVKKKNCGVFETSPER